MGSGGYFKQNYFPFHHRVSTLIYEKAIAGNAMFYWVEGDLYTTFVAWGLYAEDGRMRRMTPLGWAGLWGLEAEPAGRPAHFRGPVEHDNKMS